MAELTELERGTFAEKAKVQKPSNSVEKEQADFGDFIYPTYDQIPPDSKAQKFLDEGLRSWVFIAISAIADEISTIDINVFKRSGTDWVENFDNQILNVINQPNLVQTKEELMWLLAVYLLAEGEAPLLLNNSKNPTEMVPLNPSKVTMKFDKADIIKEYIYERSDGSKITIDKDLMVFVKIPNVHTPFRGGSTMRYIAETLDIDKYIDLYLLKFFYNDATPGSVVETEQELSNTAYTRLQLLLKSKHQGVKRAHKNLILEGGLKWKDVGMKLSDIRIKELTDGIRDKVLALYKVPKSILGIVEDVNLNNAETSDRVFAKRCILPKLKLIQGQINMFFVSKYSDGKNYWVEFENPAQDDVLRQAQVDEIYVKNGIWEINEIRHRMEMPPLEDKGNNPGANPTTDNTTQGQNTTETDKILSGRKHRSPWIINRFKGVVKVEKRKEVEKKEETDSFSNVFKDMLESDVKNITKSWTVQELDQYHAKKVEATDPIEEAFKKDLSAYFDREEKKVLEKVKSFKKKDVSVNLDDNEEADIMAELSVPYIEDTLLKEGALAYAFVGLSDHVFDTQDEKVRKFIKDRSLKLGKTTSETTRADLEGVIQQWNDDKGTIDDLRTMIADYFQSARTGRADVIARTEVSRAAGYAQESVYQEVGAVGKQWITASDERVCPFCSEMDGKTTGISENYWDQGEELVGSTGGTYKFDFEDISTPPLHPACRCDLIPIFEGGKNMNTFRMKNQRELDRLKEIEKKERDLEKKEKRLKKESKKD